MFRKVEIREYPDYNLKKLMLFETNNARKYQYSDDNIITHIKIFVNRNIVKYEITV